MEESSGIRSVERAVDVLTHLARADGPVSVTGLQRALHLSRPTLYRLLHTLAGKGLVRSFGEPQRFALDYRVVELAGAWLGRNDIPSLAQPHLTELWRRTDETVALFVMGDPTTKICVQELQSRQALVFTRGVGFTEPVTAGSSGKAILAFMPEADIEAAIARLVAENDRGPLRRELAKIRRDGYSLSHGEIIDGATAMAAPVFDRSGTAHACLSLFGPEARIKGAHLEECIAWLCQAAHDASAANGYRPVAAAE